MHILFLEPFLTPLLYIIIIFVLLSGFLFIRSIYKKEKEFEKKRESEFTDYDTVLNQAHTKAENIIQKATDEATQLQREGHDFSKHVTQQVDETLKAIIEENIVSLKNNSDEFLTTYQQSLENFKNTYEQNMEKIIQTIQQDTKKDFEQLQEKIRQKTIGSQAGFIKQVDEEFAKAQLEINDYKKHKFQEINQNMAKLVMKVSEEVLGQVIPLQQHQQLIIDALEKAEKEGVFSA